MDTADSWTKMATAKSKLYAASGTAVRMRALMLETEICLWHAGPGRHIGPAHQSGAWRVPYDGHTMRKRGDPARHAA
jgi:hypothetical protein